MALFSPALSAAPARNARWREKGRPVEFEACRRGSAQASEFGGGRILDFLGTIFSLMLLHM
jgi:hypothetical protein